MLSPYEMDSVIITGPNDVQEDVIKELHKLKVLHILEHSKNDLADIGKPLENASNLSEALVKIRALISALNIKKENVKFEIKRNLLDIQSTTRKLNEDVNSNSDELRKTEELIAKNKILVQELEILKGIDIPLESFTDYKSLAYFTGFIKNNINALEVDLSKLTKKFMMFNNASKKNIFIVLFIDAENKLKAKEILQKFNFLQQNFANIGNLKGNASSNLKKIEEEISKLKNEKQEIKKKLGMLTQQYGEFLIAADEFLREQLEKAEAPLKFASTKSSFLIKGWIPANELKSSIEKLNKASKNKIFVAFQPAKKNDDVPIKLNNPNYAKPFEFFIDLYSMPTYKEIDPTFFMFITYPIMFGIMLGDIGYGVVGIIFFWWLKKKMPKSTSFLNVLILASFVAIIFGFFFGELFGFEFINPVISRERDMITLMFIAIGIGVVHVNLGLIIGFANEWKSHGLMHAIYAKAGWIVLELGVAMVALSYFKIISISWMLGAAFLLISILMLLKGEGIKALLELPSIFTNIMSYIRLMAIGVSSVILALIINDSAKKAFHNGGVFVLMGVLILIIGHLINIFLGWLGSFLHSMRLHYVEFFSKFYHGGAKKYQPFGLKE